MAAFEFLAGLYKVIRVSALPDVEFGGQPMRKASPYMFHSLRQIVGCEEQVDVVRHYYVRMKFVEALGAVVLENIEEEFCVGFGLEESTAIGSNCRDEESACDGGSRRLGHRRSLCVGDGRRISRFGCAFTPAFGRAEARFARGFMARLKSGPSGSGALV
jgi:hypothetical protein